MDFYGNEKILNLPKTAFLCSRQVPARVVLKSYDWARAQRDQGNCIICGNHSPIEKDVFDLLLKGSQPLILVLARGLKTRWEPAITRAVADNRLLVISPFDKKVRRVTRETARIRNRQIIELADNITIGYARVDGQLSELLKNIAYFCL